MFSSPNLGSIMQNAPSELQSKIFELILLIYIPLAVTSLVESPTMFFGFSFLERSLGIAILGFALSFFSPARQKQFSLSYFQLFTMTAAAFSFIANNYFGSVKDLFCYLLIALTGIQIVAISKKQILVKGIAFSGLLSLALSLFATLFSPETAWGPDGQLQGFYGHWNSLGLALVFSFPAALTIQLGAGKHKQALKMLLITSLTMGILATKSSTSLISALALLTIWGVYILFGKNVRAAYFAVYSLVFIIAVNIIFPGPALSILGKTESLTGRVPIWESLIGGMKNHFMFGYGWSSLFPIDSPLLKILIADTGVPARHAHNDLLNWFVLTGIVGVLSVLAGYMLILVTGSLFYKKNTEQINIWPPLAAFGLAIQGITEISTATPQGWLIYSVLLAVIGSYSFATSHRYFLIFRVQKSKE